MPDRASARAAPACRSERGVDGRDDEVEAVRVELPEHLRKEPGGLAGRMRGVEVIPHRRKRRTEIAEQLRQHLADG